MSTTKKTLKLIVPLLVGGFLIWYSLRDITFDTIITHFKHANYWWIGLSVVLGLLSHLSRAYRWKYLLSPMGYKIDVSNSFMAVLVAYLVNLALPRAGEVSRATIIKKYDNIPFEKGFGTIVAERISDIIMMLIILTITLLLQFDFIFNLISQKEINPVKILVLFFIAIIALLVFKYYIKRASGGFLYKIKNFFIGLLEGVMSIFRMKHKWSYVGHTVFIWAMYVLMFWVTTKSVEGLDVPLKAILVGFIGGSLSIAITNGGIGLYPIAVASAFSLFAINDELSKAFAWIMWTSQTLMIIILGVLSFLFLPIYNSNKAKRNS